MPMSEIKERINKERTDFYQDPLNYRLHGGESLGDLIRVRWRMCGRYWTASDSF